MVLTRLQKHCLTLSKTVNNQSCWEFQINGIPFSFCYENGYNMNYRYGEYVMTIAICIGSSCHLKGSEELVTMFEKAIEENGLQDRIELVGSFCLSRCNREGVTIKVDEKIYPGINRETFGLFFRDVILTQFK